MKKAQKSKKILKSEEILQQRSAIAAVDTRKRSANDALSNSKVTDGIVQPKQKKNKNDWVSHKEWLRLKQVAKEGTLEVQRSTDSATYDPWAAGPTESVDNQKLEYVPKEKPKVAPSTLKEAPIALTANGKPVPAVKKPTAAVSYNPEFESWQGLLKEEGEKEIEAEKQRLEEKKRQEEVERLAESAKHIEDEPKPDDETEWEGFESEYEITPEWLNKKVPKRKTTAQRTKAKRRKDMEARVKWEEKMKRREQELDSANSIMKPHKIIPKHGNNEQENAENASDSEGDDRVLRRRPLGNLQYVHTPHTTIIHLLVGSFILTNSCSVPQKPLELVLPDEMPDSLRRLRPEGNLLNDRFRNLLINGKLEVRKPITQPKKKNTKLTEKWSYKDFRI